MQKSWNSRVLFLSDMICIQGVQKFSAKINERIVFTKLQVDQETVAVLIRWIYNNICEFVDQENRLE